MQPVSVENTELDGAVTRQKKGSYVPVHKPSPALDISWITANVPHANVSSGPVFFSSKTLKESPFLQAPFWFKDYDTLIGYNRKGFSGIIKWMDPMKKGIDKATTHRAYPPSLIFNSPKFAPPRLRYRPLVWPTVPWSSCDFTQNLAECGLGRTSQPPLSTLYLENLGRVALS